MVKNVVIFPSVDHGTEDLYFTVFLVSIFVLAGGGGEGTGEPCRYFENKRGEVLEMEMKDGEFVYIYWKRRRRGGGGRRKAR